MAVMNNLGHMMCLIGAAAAATALWNGETSGNTGAARTKPLTRKELEIKRKVWPKGWSITAHQPSGTAHPDRLFAAPNILGIAPEPQDRWAVQATLDGGGQAWAFYLQYAGEQTSLTALPLLGGFLFGPAMSPSEQRPYLLLRCRNVIIIVAGLRRRELAGWLRGHYTPCGPCVPADLPPLDYASAPVTGSAAGGK